MRKSWAVYVFLLLALPSLAMGTTLVSTGSVTIPGTFSFDFDAGVVDNFVTDSAADVFWEQFDPTTRALNPENGALIANIGVVDPSTLTLAQVLALPFGSAGLDGSDVGSVLVSGDVFAVFTNSGNYALGLVTGPFDGASDNGLPLAWITVSTASATPEPASMMLLGSGALALLGVIRRKRNH